MTRLIDADELRALVEQRREAWMDRGYTGAQLLDIIHTIDAMPPADCKTCNGSDRCLRIVEFVGGTWRVTSCSLWAKR